MHGAKDSKATCRGDAPFMSLTLRLKTCETTLLVLSSTYPYYQGENCPGRIQAQQQRDGSYSKG